MLKSRRLAVTLYCSVVVCSAGALGVANAQDVSNITIQRQVDDAFRQVLTSPGNLDVGLRYARLQVQAGNYEGGVASLERLLLDPAAPPTVRIELAVLYYRLGSYAAAEGYARAAISDPALDPASRKLAEGLLADIAKRAQPSQLSGFVMFGLRGQSNALARTDEPFLRIGGALTPRAATQKVKADTDLQLIGRVEHAQDLQTQNSAYLVSNLTSVLSHYNSVGSYRLQANSTNPRDLFLLEATSGVRFKPDPAGLADLTLRPHLILGGILLNGERYSGNAGVGLDVSYRVDEWNLIEATYELRQYSFADRVDVFEARQQAGAEQTLRLRVSHETTPGQFLIGELIGRDHRAGRDYYQYLSGELRATYAINYRNPFAWDERIWTVSLASGVLARDYAGADPLVDASRKRADIEVRTTLTQVVPVADAWSAMLQLEHVNASSNLPNYRYGNLSALAAVLWRF